MARGLRTSLALAAVAGCGALQHEGHHTCKGDDVSFAEITFQTCEINWSLNGRRPWSEVEQVGCWKLLAYNTNKILSSTVYQNVHDKRCVLGFSGYHGALTGYLSAAFALTTPMTTWRMCGYDVYAPYVKVIREHFKLGNWSKLANLLGGAKSPCKGPITFTAESMGGSSGEILAACANNGMIAELQDKSLPAFPIEHMYTFGAPASARTAIKNPLRADGCFPGKRIFFSEDIISHAGKSLGGLQHAHIDAVEIWPSSNGPTLRAYPCEGSDAVRDTNHPQPPPLNTTRSFKEGKFDIAQHAITSYEDQIQWLHDAGLDRILEAGPTPGEQAAKYIKYAKPSAGLFSWR